MSRRQRRSRLPEPVADITIESMAHDGRGVARLDGKTIFIEGALPEERVAIEYLATHRKFDEARAAAIHRPSADRVLPRCPHFGICGGCSLQHLDAAAQIHAKQQVLLDNLKHIGGVLPGAVLAPMTGPVWGYRGKARLGVKDVIKKGRVLVGFREKRGGYIADLSRCEVMHPSVGERLGELAALIASLDARARIPQVEVAVSEAVTALVFRHLDPLESADLERLCDYARASGMHVYLQGSGPESVRPLAPVDSVLSYQLSELQVEIRFLPHDFTQVNAVINRQMIARVLQMLEVDEYDRVLDLFCGLGNFTLPLARQAGSVTGVEGEAGLVSRARDNAALNALENVAFHVADLAKDQRGSDWAGGNYNKVLLDPPRSGAAECIDTLGNIAPEKIVYVSCHPGSLARDAGRLVQDKGYRLLAAGVMDMFPHTAHVESIALFARD